MKRPIDMYFPMTSVSSTICAGVEVLGQAREQRVVDARGVGAEPLGVLERDPLGVGEVRERLVGGHAGEQLVGDAGLDRLRGPPAEAHGALVDRSPPASGPARGAASRARSPTPPASNPPTALANSGRRESARTISRLSPSGSGDAGHERPGYRTDKNGVPDREEGADRELRDPAERRGLQDVPALRDVGAGPGRVPGDPLRRQRLRRHGPPSTSPPTPTRSTSCATGRRSRARSTATSSASSWAT